MFYHSLRARVGPISRLTNFPINLIVLVSLSTVFPVNAQQQQSGCSDMPYQDWYWVNVSEPCKKIRGTLTERPRIYGEDSFFADFDWNFYVIPDDHTTLTNSKNYANWDGKIELEVCTFGMPGGLPDAFAPGSRIEAYGEWVEDYGHDPLQHDIGRPQIPKSDEYGGKTELHPLYWIKTLDQNPMKVFLAQDMSGRFVDAQNVLWEWVEYPISPFFLLVEPGQIPPSSTQVFHETASIALGVASSYVSPYGYSVFVQLEPGYFSNCENRARVINPERSPHYFGSILRSSAPLLKEKLWTSVNHLIDDPSHTHLANDPSHQKIVTLHVEVELLDPPGSLVGMPDLLRVPLVSSSWEYESSAGVVGMVREQKTTPPHRIKFDMPYSPAAGYHQNMWRMNVLGATGDNGPSEPLSYPSNLSRAKLTESRIYCIPPSRIKLSETEKGSGACVDNVYLTVDKSKLLPEIDLRSLKWLVKVLSDSDGDRIESPSSVVVTPESPLEDLGYSINTYPPPSEDRLDVHWKKLASGKPNRSGVLVIAEGVTELGERVSATLDLAPHCRLGSFPFTEVIDYSQRYMWRKNIWGELYDPNTIRGLSAEDREWLIALDKFRRRKTLTEREERLLLDVVKIGATLPEQKRRSLRPMPEHLKTQ